MSIRKPIVVVFAACCLMLLAGIITQPLAPSSSTPVAVASPTPTAAPSTDPVTRFTHSVVRRVKRIHSCSKLQRIANAGRDDMSRYSQRDWNYVVALAYAGAASRQMGDLGCPGG
jgi:hypothetical protein